MKQILPSAAVLRVVSATLVVAVLFLPRASEALAAPSPRPANANGVWAVSISGLNGLVCVGESYMQTVQWGINPGHSDLLAPLVGPKVIMVSAKQGSFDHSTERPASVSGTVLFDYTAEKLGTETLTVQVFNSEDEVDATATASFEVKKCDYLYNLYGQMNVEVQGDDMELSFNYVVKSKGILTAPDPSQPHKLEGKNKTLTVDTTITSASFPDCTLMTWEPGHGLGFVDSEANEAEKGAGIDLKIGPPQDLTWVYDMTAYCDGQPVTVNAAFPIQSSKDPWIEQVYNFGEGEYPVKIDLFDEGVANFKRSSSNASYTARLSLKRIEK